MDLKCSMNGCDNTLNCCANGSIVFYKFPTEFNLCMSWVQNCGKIKYFNDFAYSGALSFLNHIICSEHFKTKDYINPENLFEGIKADSVPFSKNIDANKKIIDEVIFIKQEETESLIEEFIDENSNGYSSDETSNNKFAFNNPVQSNHSASFKNAWLNVLNLEKLKLGRTFGLYKSAETKSRYKKRKLTNALRNAKSRAKETDERRKERLYKNAVRAALKRSLETENEQKIRRMKNAVRTSHRRFVETLEQREDRRIKDAARAAIRRNRETEAQRTHRKMVDVIRAAKRRSMESPEQRESRLKTDRERARKRRLLRKLNDIGLISEFLVSKHDSNSAYSESSSVIDRNDMKQQANDTYNSDVHVMSVEGIKSEMVWY